eukprot:gnl/TRDRNA2_/TRDRNA2_74389_c0_seq1.p1 gnl/TRDRNA2_/TRDRNA2_74389_c0~~gnl/TRDRNA2_/TRDRNA2_74389_c0_seq1.p1  ORF type:complete len:299 (+),score=45.37 gnl/TRDRNA2_/TRDRNA2_74389_c0_seq1:131-1027(+)
MTAVHLTVQSLAGSVIASVDAEPHWSLQQVKIAIEEQVPSVPAWRQRLVFGTRVLGEADSTIPLNMLDLPPHTTVQLIVIDLLPPEVDSLLVAIREEPNPWDRLEAAQKLARYGKPVVDRVGPLLSSEHITLTRKMAAHTLGLIGPDAADYAAEVTAMLRDPQGKVRHDAARACVRIGASTAPHVASCLAEPEAHVRRHAAAVLGQLGEAAVPYADGLGHLLADPDAGVRAAAALALGQLGEAAAGPYASALASLCDIDDSEETGTASSQQVRHAAAAALGQLSFTTQARAAAIRVST